MPKPKIYPKKTEVRWSDFDFYYLKKKAVQENTTVSELIRRIVYAYQKKGVRQRLNS